MRNGSLFLKSPGSSNNNKVYACSPYIVVGGHVVFTATSMGYIKVVIEGKPRTRMGTLRTKEEKRADIFSWA